MFFFFFFENLSDGCWKVEEGSLNSALRALVKRRRFEGGCCDRVLASSFNLPRNAIRPILINLPLFHYQFRH